MFLAIGLVFHADWYLKRHVGVTFVTSPSMLFVGHVLLDFTICGELDSKTVANWVANVLVRSRLNYCNSLYQVLSKSYLRRLQCLQNIMVSKV